MASADVEAATALKLQGNKAFAEHDWPVAVDFYTQAIEKYDQEPSFFCNRAQVCFRWKTNLIKSMLTGTMYCARRKSNLRRTALRLPMLPRH